MQTVRPCLSISLYAWPAPKRGVTFIEIMVVLLILAVFMVVMIPSMKGFHRQGQVNSAVREFVLAARYARQQAVLRNHTTHLVIDSEHHAYRLVLNPNEKKRYRTSREERGDMEEEHRLSETLKRRIRFKSIFCATDPAMRSKQTQIEFYKNGSASAATVVIADVEERCMTVEIASATGGVRAYAGLPREEKVEMEPMENTVSTTVSKK